MTEDDSEYRTQVIIAFSYLPIAIIITFPRSQFNWQMIQMSSEDYTSFKNSAHLQHEDLARGLVDVKLALVWPVSVDALPGEEVHDVLWPVLVAICGRDLEIEKG